MVELTTTSGDLKAIRLADAVAGFLQTITATNTRRGYAVVLNRLSRDFGEDANPSQLDPRGLAEWFEMVWGGTSPQTFNVRLAGLRTACEFWRRQGWLDGDPLVRVAARTLTSGEERALTRTQIHSILGLNVPLRESLLWHMLYESAARAEDLLTLDVQNVDMVNRLAFVVRRGAARRIVVWQTRTAHLLNRMLCERRSGPLFLTTRRARPTVSADDVDPTTGRARLSYRRAAELFGDHTAAVTGGPFTLHQLRHSSLTHAAEDGASAPMLMRLSGHRSPRSVAKYGRPSVEVLAQWRAQTDPATIGIRSEPAYHGRW